MTKKEVYHEIEQTFGKVPTFFKAIPERSLSLEWELFKVTQLNESPIPNKYRELIGLGIAAATKCKYCAFYHTEVANHPWPNQDPRTLQPQRPARQAGPRAVRMRSRAFWSSLGSFFGSGLRSIAFLCHWRAASNRP